jgi:hypothetical protein
MSEFLRPKQIAERLGTSHNFVSKVIGASKCREIKKDGEKTLFSYSDIVEYIRKQA